MKIVLTICFSMIFKFVLSQNNSYVELNKNLYFDGDTIYGAAIFTGEKKDSYLEAHLIKDQETLSKLIFEVKGSFGSFYIKIPSSIEGGLYTIIFLNSNNGAFINSKTVLIENLDTPVLYQYLKPNTSELIDTLMDKVKLADTLNYFFDKNNYPLLLGVTDLSLDLPEKSISIKCNKNKMDSLPAVDSYRLNGQLTENNNVAPYKKITLTSYGANPLIEYQITNEKGLYSFSGLSIQDSTNAYISVPNGSPNLVYGISKLPKQNLFNEECIVNIMATKVRYDSLIENNKTLRAIKTAFKQVERSSIKADKDSIHLIDADYTINLSEYKPFGSFEEIIKEVIPYTYFKNGRLRIFNESQRKSFSSEPFIIVNGIPLKNDSLLRTLPVDKISHIQVVNSINKIASIGTIAQNGLIYVHIKDHSISVPKNTISFKLPGFQKRKMYTPPYYEDAPFIESCLLWSFSRGNSNYKFRTPDYQTKLQIVSIYVSQGKVTKKIKYLSVSKRD